MARFIQPVTEYLNENFLYVLMGGYRKDWTKKELIYIDIRTLMSDAKK